MSLIAHYKLDGDLLDSSGNGRDGTSANISYSAGKIGWCGDFSSSYITIENPISPSGAFTVSFWGKTTSTSNQCFGCSRLSVGEGFSIFLVSGFMRIDTNSGFQWTTGYLFPLNEWVHVVITKTSTEKKLFINGTLFSSTDIVPTVPLNIANIYTIGVSNSDGGGIGNYLSGNIDDYRIYDHALSEKEVKELSKAKILHYTFDEFQEPTENLAPYSDYSNRTYSSPYVASSWGGDSATVTYYQDGGYNNLPYKKMTKTSGGDGGSHLDDNTYFTIEDNTTYTISVYMKASRKVTNLNGYATCINKQSSNSYRVGINPNLDTEWQRFYWTYTSGVGHAGNDYMSRHIIYIDDNLPVDIYWCGFMVEKKDHATPFTSSTRAGLVIDKSGYDNHAELELATTPQWTEDSKIGSGAYKFNGTNNLTTNQLFFDNVNQEWTASGWCKLENNTVAQIFNNFNSGNRIIHSSLKALLYANSGANDHYVYSLSSMPLGEWFHIAFVYRTSDLTCKIYLNGNLDASSYNYSSSDLPSGFSSSTIFGQGVIGLMDDVRIYATALSADDIKELYQTRASIDNKGNLFVNNINQTGHKPLLMDYTAWINGVSNSTVGNMGTNGSQNRITVSSDPWGKEIPLWESYGIDDATTGSGIYGGYNSIDNTKLYRMSWWEKRVSNGGATNGMYYAGLNGSPSGVWNLSSDTYNNNPYFWNTSHNGLPIGEWFLVVGHVWPFTYTGGINHKDSGRWRLDGSKIGNISLDFRSGPATTILRSRTLSIYQGNSGGLLHHTAYPRMDICDGTEPSIAELLSGFDSNYIDFIREKGGTSKISLNVGEKDTYAGEINEVGLPIRYIRDSMVGSSANTGNHWVEIQAFNSRDNNIALGKTAVSSILTDGNTNSSPYYSVGPATVDLGDIYTIMYLKIWHYWADARTYHKIKTEVSADNINWITVFDSDKDGEYVETSEGKEIILYPNKASIRETGEVFVREINEV